MMAPETDVDGDSAVCCRARDACLLAAAGENHFSSRQRALLLSIMSREYSMRRISHRYGDIFMQPSCYKLLLYIFYLEF
jgi:hypothetical protein